VLQSAAVFALCDALIVGIFSWSHLHLSPFSRLVISPVENSLFFAAIAFVANFPVLTVVRRFLPKRIRRLALAIIGAMLFPVPLVAWNLFTGARAVVTVHSIRAVLSMLPFVLACTLLGWLLADRLQMKAATAP
jgi:hypothetical protein